MKRINDDFEKELYIELNKYELSNSDIDILQEIIDRYAFEFDTPQTRAEIFNLMKRTFTSKIEARKIKLKRLRNE